VNEVSNNRGYEAEGDALKHDASLRKQKQVAGIEKHCLSTQIVNVGLSTAN